VRLDEEQIRNLLVVASFPTQILPQTGETIRLV